MYLAGLKCGYLHLAAPKQLLRQLEQALTLFFWHTQMLRPELLPCAVLQTSAERVLAARGGSLPAAVVAAAAAAEARMNACQARVPAGPANRCLLA
jgi:hypothetical protein